MISRDNMGSRTAEWNISLVRKETSGGRLSHTCPMADPRIHTFTYTVVLERDPNGDGYVATCPALPGLVTEGETIEKRLTWHAMRCAAISKAYRKMVCRFLRRGTPVVSPISVQLASI